MLENRIDVHVTKAESMKRGCKRRVALLAMADKARENLRKIDH